MAAVLLILLVGVAWVAFLIWRWADGLPEGHPGKTAVTALLVSVVSAVVLLFCLFVAGIMALGGDVRFGNAAQYLFYAWLTVQALAWGRVLFVAYDYSGMNRTATATASFPRVQSMAQPDAPLLSRSAASSAVAVSKPQPSEIPAMPQAAPADPFEIER